MRSPLICVVAGAALAAIFGGCGFVSISAPPGGPPSPETLSAAQGPLDPSFGPAIWALDPSFPDPGPEATELHILVWDQACSSGIPTTGRMSPALIAYGADSVTITIGVRPLGGIQSCVGPPGTPAVVVLDEPLGDRTLVDGGRVPPGPPSPPY